MEECIADCSQDTLYPDTLTLAPNLATSTTPGRSILMDTNLLPKSWSEKFYQTANHL